MEQCLFCNGVLEQSTRVCPFCGRDQPADATIAPAVAPSASLAQRCPQCEAPARREDRWCTQCASPLWAPCDHCGEEVAVWATFCPKCAQPFTSVPGQSSEGAAPAGAAALPGNVSATTGAPARPRSIHPRVLVTMRARIITGLLILVILAAGGVTGLIVVGGGKSSAKFSHTPTPSAQRVSIITEFPLPTPEANPLDITAGPDGNLWFTAHDTNQIGRITLNGQITLSTLSTVNSGPIGITTGPDGSLWFTEHDADQCPRRGEMANALQSERILSVFTGSLPHS